MKKGGNYHKYHHLLELCGAGGTADYGVKTYLG